MLTVTRKVSVSGKLHVWSKAMMPISIGPLTNGHDGKQMEKSAVLPFSKVAVFTTGRIEVRFFLLKFNATARMVESYRAEILRMRGGG